MTAPPDSDATHVTHQIERRPEGRVLRVQQLELELLSGPTAGTRRALGDGLLLGSDAACDLVLADPTVSRRHCEVRLTGNGLVLRDLQSSNGSYLDGVRVSEAWIEGPCLLRLGGAELRLHLRPEHSEHPLSDRSSFGGLRGSSLAMQRCFALLERAAASDATVLLSGETGTGKDLAAESLHSHSARRDGPLVVVDCGAVASGVIESELFGHRRGAFSGADRDRAGAFESADGGTLFLDEIGELPLDLQPKLLRALDGREIKRLGDNQHRSVDLRLVAATHRDLQRAVEQGEFREDLFYRLSVIQIALPPLRDRPEDILALAQAFLDAHALDASHAAQVLSNPVRRMLEHHDWPGNVRELRNVVERLVLFPDDPEAALPGTRPAEAGSTSLYELPFHEARRQVTEQFERAYLSAALAATRGVVSHAASRAELPRQSFHRLLSKYPELREDPGPEEQDRGT